MEVAAAIQDERLNSDFHAGTCASTTITTGTVCLSVRLQRDAVFVRTSSRAGCEYKCVGSHDSCHALPGGKVESKAGGSAWEDSDGARGWTVFASAAAVLAGLAF